MTDYTLSRLNICVRLSRKLQIPPELSKVNRRTGSPVTLFGGNGIINTDMFHVGWQKQHTTFD